MKIWNSVGIPAEFLRNSHKYSLETRLAPTIRPTHRVVGLRGRACGTRATFRGLTRKVERGLRARSWALQTRGIVAECFLGVQETRVYARFHTIISVNPETASESGLQRVGGGK